jgi:signal transduction histidine kinase/CheY-like chemotaxis protein
MNDQVPTREELLDEVSQLRAQLAALPAPPAGVDSLQPRRIEATGEVATVLSHRLNNLLMVIMCSAEFIRDALSLNSQAYADVEELLGATREAIDLTRKLKAFSGRQQLARRAVDLNQFLGEMSDLLQRLVGDAIRVELLPQAGLPPVTADPGQLHQVLRHLALNAGEAMPGGGCLTLATGTASPTPSAAPRDLGSGEAIVGDFITIAVGDTGYGIPEGVLGRILEPFFTTKPGAQGLGLSAAYGIIRQHRGFLAVEAPPAGGTVFRIYLPGAAAPEAGGEPAAAGTTAAPPPASETILLVEDEDSLRRLTARYLAGLGYRVLSASTAEAAVELMRQHAGEVVLLISDVGLPGMDGKALAGKLTAEYPQLKTILVSGFPGDLLEQHGLGRRSGVLMKPFTREALERRIREMLGKDGTPT